MNSITVSKTALANAGIFSALMYDESSVGKNQYKGVSEKLKFEGKVSGDLITIDFAPQEQTYRQNFESLLKANGVNFLSK
jgi:hypothetical protein